MMAQAEDPRLLYKMAESKTYSAQKALNTCPDHGHEEIEMYCKTCREPVCTKCVKENHIGHDWDTLVKMAKVLRKQTSQKKLEIESVSKSILVGIEEVLTSLTSGAESELTLNRSELDSKRKTIVDFVNKSFHEMKSKCRTKHKSKMRNIEEQRGKIESKGKRMNFLIQNMETGAKEYTDYDLTELHDELGRLLSELQDLAEMPQSLRERIIYRPGSSDRASLESLVGSVAVQQSATEVALKKEFKIGDTPISKIHIKSENEAWIHSALTTMNHLVDNSGKIKQSIDLECRVYNFALSEEDIVYFCDKQTHIIKQIDKQGNISSLFSTSPLIPLCINITRSRDLLITLVDKDSYDINSSSRRLLRRVSMSGEAIMEYEFDNDGRRPLFCKPMNPIEHFSGNICVVNENENEPGNYGGTIYGINCRGKVIFRYNGIDGDFNPLDICCDNEGNILISDCLNSRIHVIDSNGKFLRYLLTKKSFSQRLYAIALFGKELWIGSRDTGLVKVFNFKY